MDVILWCTVASAVATVLVTSLTLVKCLWKRFIYFDVCSSRRVVVITGCDSGIGYQLAKNARTWGWTVVATCLEPEGEAAVSLRQAGIHTVQLDFTKPNNLDLLLDKLWELQLEYKVLWCLINNAGVMTYAHLEWQTRTMVENQVQVNLTGTIQITRALLPTIRKNAGRVVMVSSPAGQVATDHMSVYCATKWGIEGFTQSLRLELAATEACVVLIRPCNLPGRTGILCNNSAQLDVMIEEASEETLEAYGNEMRMAQVAFEGVYGGIAKMQDLNDPRLLHCFRRAITSGRPAASYSAAPLVVRFSLGLLQMLPTSWLHYLVKHGAYYKILSLARNY